jgi:hypothetical protein
MCLILYLTTVQPYHSECSQLTAHTNKHAMIDRNEQCSYYQESCITADSVYVSAWVTMCRPTKQLFKLNTLIADWISLYVAEKSFLFLQKVCVLRFGHIQVPFPEQRLPYFRLWIFGGSFKLKKWRILYWLDNCSWDWLKSKIIGLQKLN